MATLPVFNIAGDEVGSYEIDPAEIAPRISKQLLHDVVVMYEANLRQGSHCAKTRGQVSGSTKKLYRQKGTGNARAGSKRTNVRRGGGVARTSKPRDYSYRMTKMAVNVATRMAIATKIADNGLVVVDALNFEAPKTKQVATALKALGPEGLSTLVVLGSPDTTVYLSARNIEG